MLTQILNRYIHFKTFFYGKAVKVNITYVLFGKIKLIENVFDWVNKI